MARKIKTIECVELEIILEGTEPVVWRKILVPVDITMERLHLAIQLSMGWLNYHLYNFVINGVRYEDEYDDELDIDDPPESMETRLCEAVFGVRKFQYFYDYGDGWKHTIQVGKRRKISSNTVLPSCIDGANACPPEDCGGIGGFQNMKEILNDKKHEEHDNMMMWVGGSYEAERFSLEEANGRLHSRQK